MCSYTVKFADDEAELLSAEKLYIKEFRQGTEGFEPETFAQLVWLRGRGLLCRMESRETDIRTEVADEDGAVWNDSCQELFINFNPAAGDFYLNLEGNPLGTLHCKYGKDRHERKTLASIGCDIRPKTEAELLPNGWEIKYFIPNELINTVFGSGEPQSGDVLKANLYKCGDKTSHPHYGMWSRVECEALDFHRPEYFGELILE